MESRRRHCVGVDSSMLLPVLKTPPVSNAPVDRRGRTVGYLRFSITRACHMRCVYCRPEFDQNIAGDELTASEIESIACHAVSTYGVHKIRLTGGDPTARADLLEIITRLARIRDVDDLSMTTHGLSLASHAREYARAGLRRVNVSLDSLEPETFAGMTGTDTLVRVRRGIDEAIGAFEGRVKINTVVVRDHNLAQLPDLLVYAADRGVEVRFIELMPMGPLAAVWAKRFVPEQEMRDALAGVVDRWSGLSRSNESARRWVVTLRDGREANVGFITPMSCNFCADCNRLRIASDGAIYPCLMDAPAGSILTAVRPAFDPVAFDRAIASAFAGKQDEHPHDGYATMTHIGG